MQGYVYILSNRANTTLYVGVTSDLLRRIHEHRTGAVAGFTKRYKVEKLVFFEQYGLITDAIQREKQIKAGSRADKNALVERHNPQWRDLYEDIVG